MSLHRHRCPRKRTLSWQKFGMSACWAGQAQLHKVQMMVVIFLDFWREIWCYTSFRNTSTVGTLKKGWVCSCTFCPTPLNPEFASPRITPTSSLGSVVICFAINFTFLSSSVAKRHVGCANSQFCKFSV